MKKTVTTCTGRRAANFAKQQAGKENSGSNPSSGAGNAPSKTTPVLAVASLMGVQPLSCTAPAAIMYSPDSALTAGAEEYAEEDYW
ncbi:unnamed protein product [Gongylonema pulchrum]|uniref:Uncharacterized protein n=1 Tax=Gongylonema pulchrum TaxID=637853 RepID=A0A183EXA2_9BILA|nr:unnamed protein product [Gongylonema pulchrum]